MSGTSGTARDDALRLAALLLAGLVVALGIRANLFVAGGSDSSGYLSAGRQWRHARLGAPDSLQLLPGPWRPPEATIPLGHRAGTAPGTRVPIYPMGLPMLIAAATSMGGELAGHVVAPAFGGLLVWIAFVLARRAAGSLAGLVAAALTAGNPVVLFHVVDTMSDVPAAACWLGALALALRGTHASSVAAGVVAALAVLLRPNLAPLGAVIAAVAATARGLGWPARGATLALFGAAALAGPLLVLWSQAALYGSPFTSGYPGASEFFKQEFIARNLGVYPRLFREVHTFLPLLGLLVPVAAAGARDSRLAFGLLGIIAVNLIVHLPYLSYDTWPFLRFLLPATTALFVGFGAVLGETSRIAARRSRLVAALVPLLAMPVVWQGRLQMRVGLDLWREQGRVRLMGHYLDAALPPDAVVLAYMHSGAVAHYTGREVVRLDLIDPASLDATVYALTRMGRTPMLVLDEAIERAAFNRLFATSRMAALDWPPRASAISVSAVHLFDPEDIDRRARGERWAVDVLR